MKILIFLLFIIAILLYLCAGFAILLFIVFGGEPDSFTKQFVTAIIAATLGFGGYGVWIGAETIRDRHSFSEELEYGTKESVRHKLYTSIELIKINVSLRFLINSIQATLRRLSHF